MKPELNLPSVATDGFITIALNWSVGKLATGFQVYLGFITGLISGYRPVPNAQDPQDYRAWLTPTVPTAPSASSSGSTL